MIRRIVLENFMSHVATVVEPAPGVTVLTGPNNCGKSALVEALRCLVDNERGKWFIRHGAPQARVTLLTQEPNGKNHEIIWSVNRVSGGWYRIDGNDHPRLQGRTPEGFDLIHRLRQEEGQDVHLSRQKYPMFLLDAGAGVVAKFFSSATDVSLFLRMSQQLQNEKRMKTQRLGEVGIRIQAAEKRAEDLAETPQLEVRVQEAHGLYHGLLERQSKSRALRERLPELDEFEVQVERRHQIADTLKSLSAPPALPATEPIRAFAAAWRLALKDEARRSARSSSLRELAAPPSFAPSAELAGRLVSLRRGGRAVARGGARQHELNHLVEPPRLLDVSGLKHTINQLKIEEAKREAALDRERQILADLTKVVGDLERSLESHPTCPLCGAALTTEHLLEVALG